MSQPIRCPVQIVLGVPDEAGALFLHDEEMKVLGGREDREDVLAVARLCDGSRSSQAIRHAAVAHGIDEGRTGQILDALIAEGVVEDAATAEGRPEVGEIQRANRLLSELVGSGRLVSGLNVLRPTASDEDDALLPYFVASGQLSFANGQAHTCHGSAPTAAGAVQRALGEAVERYHHGADVRIDAFARARDLPAPALVLEAVTRQRPEFLSERGLAPFSHEQAHPWVLGEHLGAGAPRYVLADSVYYPVTSEQLGRPKVGEAIASGSAAHPDRGEAIRRGLFELVERDAVAVTWWSKRPVTALPPELIPPGARERLALWASRGREFRVINLTLDSIPVVLVLGEGDCYPFITAGCAADMTFERAIDKALLEAEAQALSWQGVHDPLPALSAALSAIDHGRLYAHPGNEHRLDWLLGAPVADPVERVVTMDELCERFAPVVVDLHRPRSASDLWVVKVLSDQLLPITFGYKSEPHGHARLGRLGLAWLDYPGYPHFLA
jgi:thiazole/oxazole-forming peptide maturase SagD family component